MQSRSTAYSQVGLNPVLYIVCTCCVIESVAWGLVAFWWQDFVLQYAQLLHAHLLRVAPQCCAFVLYTGTELLRGILHKLCSRYICTTTIYMWQPEYQVCCHDNLSIFHSTLQSSHSIVALFPAWEREEGNGPGFHCLWMCIIMYNQNKGEGEK